MVTTFYVTSSDLIITESLLHLTNRSLFPSLAAGNHHSVSRFYKFNFAVAQPLSCVRLFVTPWTAAHRAFLSFTTSWSLLQVTPIEFSSCHPLLLLPSIFPSTRVFFVESVLRIRWPEYWSFSFSVRPFSEYPGLISFRIDWFDLLAVQGTLKSLLQHHNLKAPVQPPLGSNFVFQIPHTVIGLWALTLRERPPCEPENPSGVRGCAPPTVRSQESPRRRAW